MTGRCSHPALPDVRRAESTAQVEYLETAALLGRRIAEQAIWYDGRCAWVGASLEDGRDAEPTLAYATLGPDLYGGTSGVALFLAELGAITGEPLFRRTALGAMAHALARAPELPGHLHGSLYSGWVGIAVAAVSVGSALEQEHHLEAAREMLRSGSEPIASAGFDIISGLAGSIYGLLWLGASMGEKSFLDDALRRGWDLANSADRSQASRGHASWTTTPRSAGGNLTGFSHGASGAACALLELAARTGEAELASVAERAFSYERALFASDQQNWPDLRARPGRARASAFRPSYPAMWCHGAAGIALARLRAYELTQDPVLRQEAEIGLQTTFAHTRAALRAGEGSYSLCHGLAGNADILEAGNRLLHPSDSRWHELAVEVASSGIEQYGQAGKSWPCGTFAGETPGLMLGLAGAGLFYLRMFEPAVGSVLLFRPQP